MNPTIQDLSLFLWLVALAVWSGKYMSDPWLWHLSCIWLEVFCLVKTRKLYNFPAWKGTEWPTDSHIQVWQKKALQVNGETIAELRLRASTGKISGVWQNVCNQTKCLVSDKMSGVRQNFWSQTKLGESEKMSGVVQIVRSRTKCLESDKMLGGRQDIRTRTKCKYNLGQVVFYE